MTYEMLGPGALDYLPCRYGNSKLLFRGPRRDLSKPYLAFLGGTETYGKFIEDPYPARVEMACGATCVNFGLPNAGIDAFTQDPFVIGAAARADVTVLQVMGAQNMTNRFYSVHPRRNDRFVSASSLLSTIFREVDFSEFHFTKHMLSRLIEVSPERFETVRTELEQAWIARMKLVLGQIRGKSILLWFSHHAPISGDDAARYDLNRDPLFVTRAMMDEIAPFATSVVEVVAAPEQIDDAAEGMVFSEMESMAAKEMLGPVAHGACAAKLAETIAAIC